MKNLKRDNWTYDEIWKVIKGYELTHCPEEGESEPEDVIVHNQCISYIVSSLPMYLPFEGITNVALVSFLNGQFPSKEIQEVAEFVRDSIIEDFMTEDNDYCALAYCVDDGMVYHVGEVLPR